MKDINGLKSFIKNKKIFNSVNICVTVIFLICFSNVNDHVWRLYAI